MNHYTRKKIASKKIESMVKSAGFIEINTIKMIIQEDFGLGAKFVENYLDMKIKAKQMSCAGDSIEWVTK